MPKQYPDLTRESLPPATIAMMTRRTAGIVRHCCLYESNLLHTVALSCYLQGLMDGQAIAPLVTGEQAS